MEAWIWEMIVRIQRNERFEEINLIGFGRGLGIMRMRRMLKDGSEISGLHNCMDGDPIL